jgi:hypothetical protein
MYRIQPTNLSAKIITPAFLLYVLLFKVNFTYSQERKNFVTAAIPSVEKIYLHLNQTYFTAGEDLWFKVYLVNGSTHKPNASSEIVYVELINPKRSIISRRILKTTNGSAPGDFVLPQQLKKGTYTIRAYTNYMRNFDKSIFFTKEIIINNTKNSESQSSQKSVVNNIKNKPDIQFFPEGGYLINGLLNPLGFKAVGSDGKSLDLSGKIVDSKERLITEFKTVHLGLGLLHFIPKKNTKYRAIVKIAKEEYAYDLPSTMNNGVLMTVSDTEGYYKIELRATSQVVLKNYNIIGTQRQQIIFNTLVNTEKGKNSAIIKLKKDIIKDGIVGLTLVDSNKKPIAERLLFHNSTDNSVKPIVSHSKSTYQLKDLVSLEIDMNEIASADVSLSVTNTLVLPKRNNATDIQTHLLLNSELRGFIEQPSYYFYSKDPERKKNLDLLMRTQGWSQYIREIDTKKQSNTAFVSEKGITISGKVVTLNDPTKPLVGSVFMTSSNKLEMVQEQSSTDEYGNFKFNHLNFTDTTSVLLNAKVYQPNSRKKKIKRNYKIIVDSINTPQIPLTKATGNFNSDFLEDWKETQMITETFVLNNNTILLDEVSVIGRKKIIENKYDRKRKGLPYRKPSQTVDFKQLRTDFPNMDPLSILQGRVPGLLVSGSILDGFDVYLRGSNSLNGNNKALILLNGTPLNGSPNILASDIDFIDIIKGPRAAIYGSRAANGIISIFTKDGKEEEKEAQFNGGSSNFEHPGFYYPRKFYEPKYNLTLDNTRKVDLRTTLLWKPYIELNNEHKAKISFYTSDTMGSYEVILEGVTKKGKIIKATSSFTVKNQ